MKRRKNRGKRGLKAIGRRKLIISAGLSLFALVAITVSFQNATLTGVRPEARMVEFLYSGALGRVPDDGGFVYWVNNVRQGICSGQNQNIYNMVEAFYNGAEYGAKNYTNRAYVTTLYNGLLQRTPDQGGLDWWTSQLDAGAFNRNTVRSYFVWSGEFQSKVSEIMSAGCTAGCWDQMELFGFPTYNTGENRLVKIQMSGGWDPNTMTIGPFDINNPPKVNYSFNQAKMEVTVRTCTSSASPICAEIPFTVYDSSPYWQQYFHGKIVVYKTNPPANPWAPTPVGSPTPDPNQPNPYDPYVTAIPPNYSPYPTSYTCATYNPNNYTYEGTPFVDGTGKKYYNFETKTPDVCYYDQAARVLRLCKPLAHGETKKCTARALDKVGAASEWQDFTVGPSGITDPGQCQNFCKQ